MLVFQSALMRVFAQLPALCSHFKVSGKHDGLVKLVDDNKYGTIQVIVGEVHWGDSYKFIFSQQGDLKEVYRENESSFEWFAEELPSEGHATLQDL